MVEYCHRCEKPILPLTIVSGLNADEANTTVQCSCGLEGSEAEAERIRKEQAMFTDALAWSLAPIECVQLRPYVDYIVNVCDEFTTSFHYRASMACDRVISKHREWELSLDTTLSRICFEQCDAMTLVYEEVAYVTAVDIRLDENGIQYKHARCRIRDHTHASLKIPLRSITYAPGMTYKDSVEFELDTTYVVLPDNTQYEMIDGYRMKVHERRQQCGDWVLICKRYELTNRHNCEFEWTHMRPPSNDEIMALLVIIHDRYAHHMELVQLLDNTYSSDISTTSIPVTDIRYPPTMGHKYMIKADGELTYVFDVGSFWYYTRNTKHRRIVGYEPQGMLAPFSKYAPCMRVECMPDGTLIFIDVISFMVDGQITMLKRTRHMDSDIDCLSYWNVPPNLMLRTVHDTYDAALTEAQNGDIAADGVIIKEIETSLTYRIKDPTIDLVVTPGALLKSRTPSEALDPVTGEAMFYAWPSLSYMRPNEIYECHVALDGDILVLTDYKRRYDKELANTGAVIDTVVDVLRSTDDIDVTLGRRVTMFTFLVRDYVYTTVEAKTSCKMIVDVGSGRMQSHLIFKKLRSSILMIDPELIIRKDERTNEWIDATHYTTASRLNLIHRMYQGKVKRAYIRESVEQVLSPQEIARFFQRNTVPFVYAMSLSHVPHVFLHLADYRIPQIGCCYIYDEMDPVSGTLVNARGIRMSRREDNAKQATVTFPHTTPYNEWIVTRGTFLPHTVIMARDIIEEYARLTPDVEHICRHLAVVISNMQR